MKKIKETMHAAIGNLLSWGEGILSLGWIILMGFGQARGTLQYRTAIFFLLFHFIFTAIPQALVAYKYAKQEHSHHNYQWKYLGIFFFGIAVDLNNLLESIFYLPRNDDMWYGTIVMSSLSIIMSTLSFVWYFTLVNKHGQVSSNKTGVVTWKFENPGYRERKMDPYEENYNYTRRGSDDY